MVLAIVMKDHLAGDPRQPRRAQESTGEHRRAQESTGEPRRAQEHTQSAGQHAAAHGTVQDSAHRARRARRRARRWSQGPYKKPAARRRERDFQK